MYHEIGLTPQQVAEILGFTDSYLCQERKRGRGLPYREIDGRIYYSVAPVLKEAIRREVERATESSGRVGA